MAHASKHQETPFQTIVALHPASDGIDEIDVVAKLGAGGFVHVDTAHRWSTGNMLLVSDIVVAWNSTVASQGALLDGALRKDVCFVDVADDYDLPFVVSAKLAYHVQTSVGFAEFLGRALAPHKRPEMQVWLPM